MKKTLSYFSMAALVFMGAMMTGCTSSELENLQPVNTGKKVTLTTTVSMDVTTKALSSAGVKSFAEGEQMAVIYNNGTSTVKAESKALETVDLIDGGKSAKFTFEIETPNTSVDVTYIYPAAMAKADGSVNYDALATQDGTLATLASNLDLATKTAAWEGTSLPTATLVNQLAILVLTLKNDAGGSEITSSITGLTVSDGSNNYNITRSVGAGPIYVAIRPTTSATIEVTATDGTKTYVKSLSDKTYANNNGYNLSWRMAEVIKGKFTVNSSGKQVYFSKGNLQATTTDLGVHWTWKFADHQWDKIGGSQGVESEDYTCNNYITGTETPTVSANGTVDLFGWSTDKTYLGISNYNSNSNYSGDFVDWGSHADVIAGVGTGWRILTNTIEKGAVGEWDFILNRRSTSSGIRYAKAQVNNVSGLIILPDDWSTEYYALNYTNESGKSVGFASCNTITLDNWNQKLEAHGAVFLPVAGQRRTDNHFVDYPNGRLYYWSSTPHDAETAYRVYFAGNEYSYSVSSSRRFGYSVRLVRNVK